MKTKHTLLVLAMLAAQGHVWAMESLEDQVLSNVSGADGIVIQTQSDQVAIDQLFYQDKYGSSATGGVAAADSDLFARFDGVNISPVTAGQTLGSTLKINAGSSAGGVSAFNLSLLSKPSLFTAQRFYACSSAAGAAGTSCTGTANAGNATGGNSGEWAIKSSGLGLDISSTDGLLNKNASARVKVIIDQMDVFITQQNTTTSTYNQIILGDIRANIDASGKVWVDATEGLRFNGDVSLASATTGGTNYRAGLQMSLKQRNNVGDSNTVASARYNSAAAGNIIRFGASGDLKNVDFSLRGTDDQSPDTSNIFGRVNGAAAGDSIAGSTGIAMRAKGEFSSSNFGYEIGEAGTAGRSLRFSNLTRFDGASGNAVFDLGNVYIDLLNSSKIGLPISSRLSNAIKFNTLESALADASGLNYLDLVSGNCVSSTTGGPASCSSAAASTVSAGVLAVGIRGLSLQGLATKTEFINNDTGLATSTVNGGSLVTVVNNLNGNIVFYGDNNKAGFALGMSTEGLASDNKSSTSILIADTAGKKYVGLRNIDFLLQTAGTIEMDGTAIRVSLPKALLALSGEVAVGTLMDVDAADPLIDRNFSSDASVAKNSKSDVLFGLRAKLDANNVVFDLTPGGSTGSGLGLKLDLNLARVTGDNLYTTGTGTTRNRTAGSFLQIVEPSDGSVLGFENISGHLTLYGADAVTSPNFTVDLTDNTAVFEGKILINGTRSASGVRTWGTQANDLRVGNINFYPSDPNRAIDPITNSRVDMNAPQRLGEIAMPGGEIYAKITLKPN